MAERYYGPARIVTSGDKEVSSSLVNLGKKFAGMLRERVGFKNPGRWRRVLPNGSTIEVINTGFNLPPTIFIHTPVAPPKEEGGEKEATMVCTPTVFDNSVGDFIDWGDPHLDINGNPINPPTGTKNGSHPEVVITANRDTRSLVKTYSADHQARAVAGNIDWIWNASADKPKYLSWDGPFGRAVGIGWHTTTINPGANPRDDYVQHIGSFPGRTGAVWYTRWKTSIYLDGELLIDAPRSVVSAAIAMLDNGSGVEEQYLVVLTTDGGFMTNDILYTLRFSEIGEASPAWENLGVVDWGTDITNNTTPRDIPHFFNPSGTQAIQTLYHAGLESFITSYLNVTSHNTYTTTYSIQNGDVQYQKPVDEEVCIDPVVSADPNPINISSDYDPITGQEVHLKMDQEVQGSGTAGTGISIISKIDIIWPNSNFNLIDGNARYLTVLVDGNLVVDILKENFVVRLYAIDCRYQRMIYYKKYLSIENISNVSVFHEIEGLYLNDKLFTEVEKFLPGNPNDGISNSFCLGPATVLNRPFNLFDPTFRLQLLGLVLLVTASRFIPHVYYTSTILDDVLISIWSKEFSSLSSAQEVRYVNYIGEESGITDTTKIDDLSILTNLINQPEYDVDNFQAVHLNPGVF